jgi:hypothetical protein
VPLDISAACNAEVVDDGIHPHKDMFGATGQGWVTSQWHKTVSNRWHTKHDEDNQGLPDDGRMEIPASNPKGWFQLRVDPGNDVVLLTDNRGAERFRQAVRLELRAEQQRRYGQLALLHCSDNGEGVVAVTAEYTSGAPSTFETTLHDWAPNCRTKPVVSERAAIRAKNTGEFLMEMHAQTVSLDPARVLKALTFSIASRTPRKGQPDEESALRFRAGIFAISALPVENR